MNHAPAFQNPYVMEYGILEQILDSSFSAYALYTFEDVSASLASAFLHIFYNESGMIYDCVA